jgi:endonuclease-3
MNNKKRVEIFRRFKEINPHPTTELEYASPFELLISVILSAQATDVGVNKATLRLYKIANTPQKIYDLGLDTLKDYIKTIGLFNSKASNVIKTCKLLIDNHNSQVPDNRKDLEALPGVGRKTANVVLNTAFGQPTMAVDTHIFRVSKRTKIAHGKDVLQIEKSLLRLIPDEYLMDAHHWIILHGRYICKARSPNCKECIINDLCEYNAKK